MTEAALRDRLRKARQRALTVGLVGLGLSLVGVGSDRFSQGYLLGFVFWMFIPLGSLGIVMLHHMVGGWWGFVIRRILEASSRTVLPMAALFLPLLLFLGQLYPWADPEHLAHDPLLEHKALFLNRGFFTLRAVVYFAVWIGLATALSRKSWRQDETGDPAGLRGLQLTSAGGLVLLGLTVTFAAVDWGMSLEPHWFSSIYGAIFIVGGIVSAAVFSILMLSRMKDSEPFVSVVRISHFHDLGKLLLAFVMLWAYISFSQYLIIWSGNTAEEAPWYVSRQTGGWQAVALLLILVHFLAPFLLLLSRRNKERVGVLTAIAGALLLARFVDATWLLVPAFNPGSLVMSWLYFTLPAGVGGLWMFFFLRELEKHPLIPVQDPRFDASPLPEVAQHG